LLLYLYDLERAEINEKYNPKTN